MGLSEKLLGGEESFRDYSALLVHGTSFESIESILKDGFLFSPSKLWQKEREVVLSGCGGLDFLGDGCETVYFSYVGEEGEGLDMVNRVIYSKGTELPVYMVFNDNFKNRFSEGCKFILGVKGEVSLEHLECVLVSSIYKEKLGNIKKYGKEIRLVEGNCEADYFSSCLKEIKKLECVPKGLSKDEIYLRKTETLKKSIKKDATKLLIHGKFLDYFQIRKLCSSIGNGFSDYLMLENTKRHVNSLLLL